MILTIVREQLRRQRGFIVALALIVTGAVGFATFATTMAATQGAANYFADQASGNASRYSAVAVLTDERLPQPAGSGATRAAVLADYGSSFKLADLERAIEDANAGGAHVRADASTSASITRTGVTARNQLTQSLSSDISAVWGEFPWTQILAEGRAPESGEIVLSGEAAKATGVTIGDPVILWASPHSEDVTQLPSATLRVSGIARDYGPGWRPSTAYISQGDLGIIEEFVTATSPGDDPWPMQVYIHWDQPNRAFADRFDRASEGSGARGLFGSSSPIAWLVAAALTLGTVVVAFALGRSQAQDRMRWTATARALGARRSHLLAAAGVE